MAVESVRLSNADVQDFAQRLQAWGTALPSKDRALLQMLLSHTEDDASEADVQGYAMDSIEAATMAALGPKVKSGVVALQPIAWVQLGPAWVQKG
jgi:hypothetical protein